MTPPQRHMTTMTSPHRYMKTTTSPHRQTHDNYDMTTRKNYSCHTALTQIRDSLLHNINENKYTGLLFVDFEKAFDVINHSLLLRKLHLYKLTQEMINLLKSFLSNRQQLVTANNQTSELVPIKHGVPQGSILGPLLFSIYVNDLPQFLECSCEMFADDTSLYCSDSDPHRLTLKLQNSIDRLVRPTWTQLNHMSLNTRKTKCIYVLARQKRQKNER